MSVTCCVEEALTQILQSLRLVQLTLCLHTSTGPPNLIATEKMPISGMKESNILYGLKTQIGRHTLSIFVVDYEIYSLTNVRVLVIVPENRHFYYGAELSDLPISLSHRSKANSMQSKLFTAF